MTCSSYGVECGAQREPSTHAPVTMVRELRPQYASSNPRTVTIYTIASNTNMLSPADEPKSWNDVLDPRWKGKLAMDAPRGSGPGGTIMAGVEGVLGHEWTANLAQQQVFFATQAGPLLTGLARGEYALFLSSNHTDVIAQKIQGTPIKQLRLEEGVGLTPNAQALINDRPTRVWMVAEPANFRPRIGRGRSFSSP